jgi:hypothetical protein
VKASKPWKDHTHPLEAGGGTSREEDYTQIMQRNFRQIITLRPLPAERAAGARAPRAAGRGMKHHIF